MLKGTLCGLEEYAACGLTLPSQRCPISYDNVDGNVCEKSQTNNGVSQIGTLCGIRMSDSSGIVLCGGRNPLSDSCPDGYTKIVNKDFQLCAKTDTSIDDLPGTLCGFHKYRDDGGYASVNTDCDGFYPGRGACPESYNLATIKTPAHQLTYRLCAKT